MDDPISALDASVRQKVLKNVIVDHLKGKTRLLVTHAIDFLEMADKIVIMEKGRVLEQGSFEEIKNNEKLQELVETNKIDSNKSKLNQIQKEILTNEEKSAIFDKLSQLSEGQDGRIIKDENEEVIVVGSAEYSKVLKLFGGWPIILVLQVFLSLIIGT